MDLNEFETRKQKIDVLLKEQGWTVGDGRKVIIEVDTKQSDFRAQNYRTVSETLRNDMDSKYVDYLLLDNFGAPIAIIEAKRTSKDPILTAQKQAEEYANDIKAQIGKDVFIFLSNGYEIWFWDRERYGPRLVKGFFSQKDLERLRFQVEERKNLTDFEIDGKIVDRPKSIENTKRVLEHLQKGHRKALVVMATGTGKTRLAMAIVDVLLKSGWAQKILFLADRKALRDQACTDGFKSFFPEESKSKIIGGKFNKNSRLYVSTIQAFQEIYNQKDDSGRYPISPAEFDVIISDEAHRSIYDKWKHVFTYLDAIQIGLTATPAELIGRDTFRFFNCENGVATALYDYEEAVNDGILCDFRKNVMGVRTHFQIEGVKTADLPMSEIKRLLGEGVDPYEMDFEGTDLEKKVAVKGTSEAIVREFMENCLTDQSGNHPAKSIIFAISKKHA
ncbi:MAG: DEAD/DEAH box helicase family protein, partial [Candidatus Methanospirareceae archaeon]